MILGEGGSAVDAVVTAVTILEDLPSFNAGTGSVLNDDCEIEMDAMVMEGRGLRAGGVCALRDFRNPILIAREVMEHGVHVLLAAEGAARFARQRGFEPVAPTSLVTARARRRWADHGQQASIDHGTVGAVAVDVHGDVAAATSTGGLTRKLPGRVGDTPQLGCGTYADNRGGAVSATGHGESIARTVMAKHASDLLTVGVEPQSAADAALATLARVDGRAGLIVVAPDGRLAAAWNTEAMAHAWVSAAGEEGARL